MRHRHTRRPRWRRRLAGGLVLGSFCVLFAVAATSQLRASGHPRQPVTVRWGQAAPTPAATPGPTAAPSPAATPTRKPVSYPGAAYLIEGGELADVAYRPSAAIAKGDVPATYRNGCHQWSGSAVRPCEFGQADGDRTIAIVGDSHSAQWLPALQAVADDLGWRIVSITKSSCRFEGTNGSDSLQDPACARWNANVLEHLRTTRPDLVFTTATVGSSGQDTMPVSLFGPWRELDAMGIPVIAIRDSPWHRFDPQVCVADYGPRARRCGTERAQHGLTRPIAVPAGYTLPADVHVLDFTDYYCDPAFCPAVIGNVLVYRDDHHIGATYAATIGPFLGEEIVRVMGWMQPRPQRTPV